MHFYVIIDNVLTCNFQPCSFHLIFYPEQQILYFFTDVPTVPIILSGIAIFVTLITVYILYCFTLLFFISYSSPTTPTRKQSSWVQEHVYLFCSQLCPQWLQVCLAHSGYSTCWMNSVKEENTKCSIQEGLSQSLLPFPSGTHFYFFELTDIDNRRDNFSWIIKYMVATCM